MDDNSVNVTISEADKRQICRVSSVDDTEVIITSEEINQDSQTISPMIDDSQSLIPEKIKYKNLVLSGGSIKGICHIGVLSRLWNEERIDPLILKAIVGTSVGALVGCLLVLGFTPTEIWDFLLKLDFTKLAKPDIFLFFEKCGADSGKVIFDLFEDILMTKTKIQYITFQQLFEHTGITFTVVGSNLTTKKVEYFNHVNTPNFKVSLALRISIGMPGFFTPVTLDGEKYVDGCIMDNYAMDLFNDDLENTIGILICSDFDTNYQYPEQYPMAIINLFMYHYHQISYKKHEKNTIYIECGLGATSNFDFNVDNEAKQKLFDIGYESATKFLSK